MKLVGTIAHLNEYNWASGTRFFNDALATDSQ